MGSRIKESPESTFEVYVEVTRPETAGDPEVHQQFPEDFSDQATLRAVSRFCFPFSADSLAVGFLGQNFTFVLTDIESKQRFGFCRLSGAQRCFCFLSYLPWFEVFYKLLNVVADYTIKGQVSEQDGQQRELLETLYTLPIPEPGVPVHLSVHSHFVVPDIRQLPSIPENRSLTEYFVAVDVSNILHLYASMLFERRILICCTKLSTLTSCIHGSAAMLYPMFWQHVYIPVLPQYLIDYCCAPMPYLIGVHSSLMEKVRGMMLEDVVILNVDTNTLETPYDDLQCLPNDTVSALKSRLKKVSMATGDGVARAFLKAQAALFGSYRSALQMEPGEPITFNKEVFVSHRSSTMRYFLQNATQLQLFKQFIDGRLELLNSGIGFSDVFEEEISAGEYAGSDKSYHQWLSTVKKGSGAIFNSVKTKANPAMKTAYKFAKDHARMGIKEVKSRLKQKENGYMTATKEGQEQATRPLPEGRKYSQPCAQQQSITEHLGQQACPSQLVVNKLPANAAQDSSSTEQLRPCVSLMDVGLTQEAEPREEQRAESSQRHSAPHSLMPAKAAEADLLGNIFWSLEGEPESLLPKSLVDLQQLGGAEEQQASIKDQVSGRDGGWEDFQQTLSVPPLLPQCVRPGNDVTKQVAVSNGSVDLLSLLDPLKSSPDPEAPPPKSAPSLCLFPLNPPTFSSVPCIPFSQSQHHAPTGVPHGHYTPTAAAYPPHLRLSGYAPYVPSAPPTGRGLSRQNPSLPGLIQMPLVISTPPRGTVPPPARDPFGDLLDASKPAAPPDAKQWANFN
ncbi:DENN domain-containing protein 1A-like isoform X1 [Anguilla anguilla]|uniref:DENN domain-containing protein 1A-like isoform X1 n=1 Tax=Anguilla anguilla TaxID=7936 RepID=UPI0015B2F7EF|nr:DENN domain-containing protein 1A-like isoform X1 [Anguilla anguilla]